MKQEPVEITIGKSGFSGTKVTVGGEELYVSDVLVDCRAGERTKVTLGMHHAMLKKFLDKNPDIGLEIHSDGQTVYLEKVRFVRGKFATRIEIEGRDVYGEPAIVK